MKILHLLAVGAALGLVPPVSATVKTENRNANISTPGITQVTKDLITDFESLLIDHGSSADIFSVPRTEAGIYLQDNGDQYVAKKLSVRAPESIPQWKPYLQVPTANSIFVTWRANGHKAVVKLGDTPSALSRTITGSSQMLSDATTTFEYHKVFVDGLQPDTKYYYQITGDPEIYSFRTQPAIGSKRNYRVLILGDHQKLDRSGYEWLINAAKETVNKKYGKWEDEIDIVLNPGDQVNVGTYSYYERCHFFKSYGISPYLPIMTTLGNHEMKEDADLQKYSNIFQYEKLAYQGISSGNDLYYAIQEG
ncbi:MAG: fibronectin type III domain-containing protein, partial [Bacteroidales bacterium]